MEERRQEESWIKFGCQEPEEHTEYLCGEVRTVQKCREYSLHFVSFLQIGHTWQSHRCFLSHQSTELRGGRGQGQQALLPRAGGSHVGFLSSPNMQMMALISTFKMKHR